MDMKRSFFRCWFFVGLIFFGRILQAEAPLSVELPAVAVLDQEYILFECQAAQEARSLIESQRVTFQSEIDQQEKELRRDEVALQKAQETLSEEDFLKNRSIFENRVGEVHKKVALRRSHLEQSFNKAREMIIAKMNEIITRLSQEKEFSLVFPKGAVLYAKQRLDITKDVLRELNRLLPRVEIETIAEEQIHD